MLDFIWSIWSEISRVGEVNKLFVAPGLELVGEDGSFPFKCWCRVLTAASKWRRVPAASDATFLASSLPIAVMRCMARCEEESAGLSFMIAVNKLQNPGQPRVLPEKVGSLSLRKSDVGLMREATGAGVGAAVAWT